MSKDEGKNRRRHERVYLAMDWGDASPLLGGVVSWPNHETSQIFDLSYRGLALALPGLIKLVAGEVVSLGLRLGEQSEVETKLVISWVSASAFGGEFSELSFAAREAIDEFLEDRLIGKSLRQINKKYYSAGADFSYWYHGPKDTNVFLWLSKSGQIDKAYFELDGRVLLYEHGEVSSGGMVPFSLTDAIGSGAKVVSKKDVLVSLDSKAPLLRRGMEILSQIEEQKGPLREFVNVLAQLK